MAVDMNIFRAKQSKANTRPKGNNNKTTFHPVRMELIHQLPDRRPQVNLILMGVRFNFLK